jgi:hypothetical protein
MKTGTVIAIIGGIAILGVGGFFAYRKLTTKGKADASAAAGAAALAQAQANATAALAQANAKAAQAQSGGGGGGGGGGGNTTAAWLNLGTAVVGTAGGIINGLMNNNDNTDGG